MADLGAVGQLYSTADLLPLDTAAAQNISLNPVAAVDTGNYRPLPYRQNWGAIAGTVRDSTGAFAARQVQAFLRATGEHVGSAVSDPVTGAYSIATPYPGQEHCVVFQDDAAGATLNDIVARTVP